MKEGAPPRLVVQCNGLPAYSVEEFGRGRGHPVVVWGPDQTPIRLRVGGGHAHSSQKAAESLSLWPLFRDIHGFN